MAKAKSAAFPSSASRCANGCCASPPTPRNLLTDLDTIDWSDSLKEMQRNWIGRSEGAEVDFQIADCGVRSAEFGNDSCFYNASRHFVWRDLHGARARTHDWLTKSQRPEHRDDSGYETYKDAKLPIKSDLERTELAKEKTGVFTGAYAINPVNGEKIPIWIADYVLASYGTGAIMAVPAHDERDFEFAKKFNLPIKQLCEFITIRTD